ncbi:hypothetical protein [Paenibacillus odorifer]|uniref:hypothetical protein n=1 Tax=Paenibacillus odorifer TaxID=189426 RepID=UPI0015C3E964|nr:hypothetical protein [Paenibacillus odorifer]
MSECGMERRFGTGETECSPVFRDSSRYAVINSRNLETTAIGSPILLGMAEHSLITNFPITTTVTTYFER